MFKFQFCPGALVLCVYWSSGGGGRCKTLVSGTAGGQDFGLLSLKDNSVLHQTEQVLQGQEK